MRKYVAALIREMSQYASAAEGTVFDSLFFGGGTPSLLPFDLVEHIIKMARCLYHVEEDAEITLEANPATAHEKTLALFRAAGVNRLSVGVQSLVDRELSALGRLHSRKDAIHFLKNARRAGFENINVDLMYGIPHQTKESANETLEEVLALAPEHISAYSLMLERGTPLFEKSKAELSLPSEEEEEAIDLLLKQRLGDAGYLHYEISNYAKAGRESRHNLHYWHSDPYLGFGVSAYSYFDGRRYGNHTDLSRYLASPASAVEEMALVSEEDLAYEWLMLRFRLSEGISFSEYNERFGINLKEKYQKEFSKYMAMGLMKESDGRIFLTERGSRVSNTILSELLPDK